MWNLEWDRLSVYPYKEENIQELICRIYSILQDLQANGQVVDPHLLENIKTELEKIKAHMGTELQAKIDEAIARINATADKYPQGNIITDPTITDYDQVLTLGKKFSNDQDGARYGSTTLKVRDNIGTVSGVINIDSQLHSSNTDDDFKMLGSTWCAMKQSRPKGFNITGYNQGWNASGTYFASLETNGQLLLEKTIYKGVNSAGDKHKFCALDLTFPIVKNYPLQDDHKHRIDAKIGIVESQSNEMTSNIVLASDTHMNNQYDPNYTIGNYDIYMPMLLNYANSNLGAFATVINGDVFSEKNGVKDINSYRWMMTETRRQFNENTIFVLGNHDDMSLQPEVGTKPPYLYISKEEWNKYMNRGKTGINFATNDQPYFYADDTVGQCRHIFLNSHDVDGAKIHTFDFGKNQIEWLVYALKTTPKNYSIVCYSHVSPKDSKDANRPEFNGVNQVKNGDAIHSVFVAYKNRTQGEIALSNPAGTKITVDFRDAVGFFAGAISGHEHEDYHHVIDGINYVTDDTAGHKDSFSILSVDCKNRRLKVFRMAFNGGARQDIELPY